MSATRDRLKLKIKNQKKPFSITFSNEKYSIEAFEMVIKGLITGGTPSSAEILLKQAKEHVAGCSNELDVMSILTKLEKLVEKKRKFRVSESKSETKDPIEEKAKSLQEKLSDNTDNFADRVKLRQAILAETDSPPITALTLPTFPALCAKINKKFVKELHSLTPCVPINFDGLEVFMTSIYILKYIEDNDFFIMNRDKIIPLVEAHNNYSFGAPNFKFYAIEKVYKNLANIAGRVELAEPIHKLAQNLIDYKSRLPHFVLPDEFFSLVCSVTHHMISQNKYSEVCSWFTFLGSLRAFQFIPESDKPNIEYTLLRCLEFFKVNKKRHRSVDNHIIHTILEEYLKREDKIQYNDDAIQSLKMWLSTGANKTQTMLLTEHLGAYPNLTDDQVNENTKNEYDKLNNARIQYSEELKNSFYHIFDTLKSQDDLDSAIAQSTELAKTNSLFQRITLTLLDFKIYIKKSDLEGLHKFEVQLSNVETPASTKRKRPSMALYRKLIPTISPEQAARQRAAQRLAHEHNVERAKEQKRHDEIKSEVYTALENKDEIIPETSAIQAKTKKPKKKKKPHPKKSSTKSDLSTALDEIIIVEAQTPTVSSNFQPIQEEKAPVLPALTYLPFNYCFDNALCPADRVKLLLAIRDDLIREGDFFDLEVVGSLITEAVIQKVRGSTNFRAQDVDFTANYSENLSDWVLDHGFRYCNQGATEDYTYVNYQRIMQNNKVEPFTLFISLHIDQLRDDKKEETVEQNFVPLSSLRGRFDKDLNIHIIGLTPEILSDIRNGIFRVKLPTPGARSYLKCVMKYYFRVVLEDKFTSDLDSTEKLFETGWASHFLRNAADNNINNFYNEIARLIQCQIEYLKISSSVILVNRSLDLTNLFILPFFNIVLEKLPPAQKRLVTPVLLTQQLIKKLKAAAEDKTDSIHSLKEIPFQHITINQWLSNLCECIKEPDNKDKENVNIALGHIQTYVMSTSVTKKRNGLFVATDRLTTTLLANSKAVREAPTLVR